MSGFAKMVLALLVRLKGSELFAVMLEAGVRQLEGGARKLDAALAKQIDWLVAKAEQEIPDGTARKEWVLEQLKFLRGPLQVAFAAASRSAINWAIETAVQKLKASRAG
jgi:hypothetical protein